MESCQCKTCKNACKSRPGWVKPEQAKILMEYFRVTSIRDLLGENKFAIDWWNGNDADILILAPNIKGNNNIQYPKDPRGECVFFKNDKCEIHTIKPFECASFIHTDSGRAVEKRHEKVSQLWAKSDILSDFEDEIECESFGLFDQLGLGGFLGY